jgi:hypothetical protein
VEAHVHVVHFHPLAPLWQTRQDDGAPGGAVNQHVISSMRLRRASVNTRCRYVVTKTK